MSSSPGGSTGLQVGAASVLLLVSLVPHLGLLPYAFDDAYIHLRIAEHLVETGEPYFNAGERVMASSASGWTWILALLVALPGSAIGYAATLNALLCWAGGLVFARLAWVLSGRALSGAVHWLLAFSYVAIVHYAGAGLMEVPLALLLLGVGLSLYATGRASAFALLAVAPFLRLELAVFFLALLGHALIRRRVSPPRAVLWSLAGLPPALYGWYFFGTLLPHTAVAKSTIYELTVGQALLLLINNAAPEIPGLGLGWSRWLWIGSLVVSVAAVAIHAPRVRKGVRELELVGLLLAATAVIPVVYLLTESLVFPWYVPLFLMPLTLLLGLCLASIQQPSIRRFLLGFLLLPSLLGLANSVVAALGDPTGYRHFAFNARVRKYVEIGARLGERYPGARLLSSEVGGLGHAFGGKILDGAGLISPEALKHHPMRVPEERPFGFFGAIPVEFVRETRPELIVSMDVFIGAFERSDVAAEYTVSREPLYVDDDLRRVPHPVIWNSRHMNIFIRKDLK